MLEKLWDFIVRFRTYVVNLAGAALIILPDLLSAPEVLAVIPPGYQKYIIVTVFMLNIWLRPRPASRAADPEVQAQAAAKVESKATGEPVDIMIKSAGEKAVVVATVEPKGSTI